MQPSKWEYISKRYVKTMNLIDSFDWNSKDYSYKAMAGIAEILLKNKKKQSIVHHGNSIMFAS